MEGQAGTLAGLVNWIQGYDTSRTHALIQQQKASKSHVPDTKSGDICSPCQPKPGGGCHMPSQKHPREPWLGKSLCCTGTKLYLRGNSQCYTVKHRAAVACLGLSWIWCYLIFSLMAWMMKDSMLIKSTDGTNLWGILWGIVHIGKGGTDCSFILYLRRHHMSNPVIM